jgi:uncharacterized protein YodC (DUF2158 family)
MATELKVGDAVQIKGGGIVMTVEEVGITEGHSLKL